MPCAFIRVSLSDPRTPKGRGDLVGSPYLRDSASLGRSECCEEYSARKALARRLGLEGWIVRWQAEYRRLLS